MNSQLSVTSKVQSPKILNSVWTVKSIKNNGLIKNLKSSPILSPEAGLKQKIHIIQWVKLSVLSPVKPPYLRIGMSVSAMPIRSKISVVVPQYFSTIHQEVSYG